MKTSKEKEEREGKGDSKFLIPWRCACLLRRSALLNPERTKRDRQKKDRVNLSFSRMRHTLCFCAESWRRLKSVIRVPFFSDGEIRIFAFFVSFFYKDGNNTPKSQE